jgi:hypothetical protein
MLGGFPSVTVSHLVGQEIHCFIIIMIIMNGVELGHQDLFLCSSRWSYSLPCQFGLVSSFP